MAAVAGRRTGRREVGEETAVVAVAAAAGTRRGVEGGAKGPRDELCDEEPS